MFLVENESIVHASPPQVWTAITRFDEYPRWHPFVRIAGSLTPDANVDYSFRMKLGNAKFRTVDARIVTLDAQKCLVLRFGFGWLLAFEEAYSLSPLPTGSRLVHGFRCAGLLSALPLSNLKHNFARLLETTDRVLVRHLTFRKPPTKSKRRIRKGFRPGT